ncbi:hypothetical protein BDP55DRAFT_684465 [Colletotrichum godetiae]|uniref:Uncharacterized protein n=1 Tax=Colletotrichum godetiae TaxID=1209918 RepID=A0AAJ0EQU0_9PEZI|nr:uncharacterized protein BDP55DRAFT_684465 [Colletotrichum godetiae]KAK1657813.1 hypothetical protein BDP55DRAFT_684465 [Colletotrichum godetiae]
MAPKHTEAHPPPPRSWRITYLSFSRFAASFHPPVASARPSLPSLFTRGVPSDRPAAKDPDAPSPL